MQKRVFIIHGWDGYPEEGWFPWLKKELETKGFSVVVPQLPQPDEPRISNWVSKLKEVVEKPNEQTYFVNILNSKVIIEHGKGHFSGSTGTKELPSALDAVIEMSGK